MKRRWTQTLPGTVLIVQHLVLKLVVYKPMGAERVADRTIAQSCSYVPFHSSACCHNNFALRISVDLNE